MNRLDVLLNYVIQFALRGFIVGTIFSGLVFGVMLLMSMLMAGVLPSPYVWLIVPAGTLFGTMLGSFIGFIDGILIGLIASAFLKTCKALSGAVASLSTFALLMSGFYLIAAPSEIFGPIIIFFWMLLITPILIVAGLTGWEITAEQEEIIATQAAV